MCRRMTPRRRLQISGRVTTRVKLPTGMVVGSTAVTTGAGLVSVHVPVDVAVVSARLVAVIWMVLGVGNVAGAV